MILLSKVLPALTIVLISNGVIGPSQADRYENDMKRCTRHREDCFTRPGCCGDMECKATFQAPPDYAVVCLYPRESYCAKPGEDCREIKCCQGETRCHPVIIKGTEFRHCILPVI